MMMMMMMVCFSELPFKVALMLMFSIFSFTALRKLHR